MTERGELCAWGAAFNSTDWTFWKQSTEVSDKNRAQAPGLLLLSTNKVLTFSTVIITVIIYIQI